MNERIYIKDFCEDLNYQGVILYIGNVNHSKLLRTLEKDNVGHLYRLGFAASNNELSMRDFIYVENCDLQNLDYPVQEYFEEGYDVYVLHEDPYGFYIKRKI